MTGSKNVNRLTLTQQVHGDLKPKFFSAVRSILASLSSPLAALLFGFTLTTLIRQQQEAPRNPLQKHDDVSASCYNFFSAASKWTKYVFMPV